MLDTAGSDSAQTVGDVTTILSAPLGSIAASVQSKSDRLTPGETRIAEVLIELGPELIYRSVSDVAEQAGCAISSVVRCCQSLGFKGFQDLKIAFNREGITPTQTLQGGVEAGDDPAAILNKVVGAAAEAVTTGTGFVDRDLFASATQLLGGARAVLFLGVGTSAPLAQDMSYRFLTIGVRAEAPADVHVQHVRAGLLGDGDVVVAVSHTGSTRETVSAARAARAAGAKVIAVTSFANSPLVETTNVVLVAGSRETAYRIEAMASRVAHLVVLDALFVAVATAGQDRANNALEVTEGVLADHRF